MTFNLHWSKSFTSTETSLSTHARLIVLKAERISNIDDYFTVRIKLNSSPHVSERSFKPSVTAVDDRLRRPLLSPAVREAAKGAKS
ncbi:hypothetical protein EVAR_52617_1 [Eumeta japonica]|uniref:Uncharacterized protein n=1 Tax=Eumeta variegata TaxID=151549 RepID=A0A4C1YLC5_EUMVA|nr:hypothetical protein EVAR_52617_1 [Eumeta japonica]